MGAWAATTTDLISQFSNHLCSSPCTAIELSWPKFWSVKWRKDEWVTTAMFCSGLVMIHSRKRTPRALISSLVSRCVGCHSTSVSCAKHVGRNGKLLTKSRFNQTRIMFDMEQARDVSPFAYTTDMDTSPYGYLTAMLSTPLSHRLCIIGPGQTFDLPPQSRRSQRQGSSCKGELRYGGDHKDVHPGAPCIAHSHGMASLRHG